MNFGSNEKHSEQLTELQKQDKDIKALICNNKELIDSVIAEVIEKNNTYIKSLTKKIKYGYLILKHHLLVSSCIYPSYHLQKYNN